MLRSIWDDVKREFSYGNMVTRIIIVNIAVFVIINLIRIVLFVVNGWKNDTSMFDGILGFFTLHASLVDLLYHPWSIITHMFLHEGFFHLFWNMLWMYWFGLILGDFIGNHRILPIYLMGGLAGAFVYLLTANTIPAHPGVGHALGASAAVMAVLGASGTIAPNYIMRFFIIGDVKLKYIVAVLIFLNFITISSANGFEGGAFAHLGGAFFGILYAWQLQLGTDLAMPINRLIKFLERVFTGEFFKKSKPKPHVAYRNPQATQKANVNKANSRKARSVSDDHSRSHQEQLDDILDKIKQSGYESLSDEEKEFLFNASKK
jgi:membrane associated rhomboid family serine protease